MKKKIVCFILAMAMILSIIPASFADTPIAKREYSAGTLYKKYTFYQTTTPAKRWTYMKDTLYSCPASNYSISVTNGTTVLYTQVRSNTTTPQYYYWTLVNEYTLKIGLTVYNAYNGNSNMPISGNFIAYYG